MGIVEALCYYRISYKHDQEDRSCSCTPTMETVARCCGPVPSLGRTPCKSTVTALNGDNVSDIDHIASLRRDIAELRTELRFGLSSLAILLVCNSQQQPHLVGAVITAAALHWLLTRVQSVFARSDVAAQTMRTTVVASQLLTPLPPNTCQREAAAAERVATAERTVAGLAATQAPRVCMNNAKKISGGPSPAPAPLAGAVAHTFGFDSTGSGTGLETACREGEHELRGGSPDHDVMVCDIDLVLRPRALSDVLGAGVGQADDASVEDNEIGADLVPAAANQLDTISTVDTDTDDATEDKSADGHCSSDSEISNEIGRCNAMDNIVLEHSLCDREETGDSNGNGDESSEILARSITSEGCADGFVSSPSPEPKLMRQSQLLKSVSESAARAGSGLWPARDGDVECDCGSDRHGDHSVNGGDDRTSNSGGESDETLAQEVHQCKGTAVAACLSSPTPAPLVTTQVQERVQERVQKPVQDLVKERAQEQAQDQAQEQAQEQAQQQAQEQGQKRTLLPQPLLRRHQLQCPAAPIRQPVAWRRQRRRQQEEEQQQERGNHAALQRCARHATGAETTVHNSCPNPPTMAMVPVLVQRAEGKGLGLGLKSGSRDEQNSTKVDGDTDASGHAARVQGECERQGGIGAQSQRDPPLDTRKPIQARTSSHKTDDTEASPTLQLALRPASHASAPLFSSKWLGLSPLPPPVPSPTASWPGASSPLPVQVCTPTGIGTPLRTPTNAAGAYANADHGWAAASPLRASPGGFSTPRYARACIGSPAATVAAAVAMALSPQWSSPPSSPSLTLSPQPESAAQSEAEQMRIIEAAGAVMVIERQKQCVRVGVDGEPCAGETHKRIHAHAPGPSHRTHITEAGNEPLTPSPLDGQYNGSDNGSKCAKEAVGDVAKCASSTTDNPVDGAPSSPTPPLLATPVLRAIDARHMVGDSSDRGTCKGSLRGSTTKKCPTRNVSSPTALLPLPPPLLSLPGAAAQLHTQQSPAAPTRGSALALNSPNSSQVRCDWLSPRPAGPRIRGGRLRRSQRRPRLNLLEQARASPRKRVLPPSPLSLPTPTSDNSQHSMRGNSARPAPTLALPPSPASALNCSSPRANESASGDYIPGTPTPARAGIAASPHMHVITALSPLPKNWCASPSVARSLTKAGMNLASMKGSLRRRSQLLALTNCSGSDSDNDDVESDANNGVGTIADALINPDDDTSIGANVDLDKGCNIKNRSSMLRRRPTLTIDTNTIVDTVTDSAADTYAETCVGTGGIDEPHSAKRKKSYDEVRRKVSFESLCASPCGVLPGAISTSNDNDSDISSDDDDRITCNKHDTNSEPSRKPQSNTCSADGTSTGGTEEMEDATGTKAAEATDSIEGEPEQRSSAPIFAANFVVLHPLGTGSFAEVTCCRCRADGRRYAVKRSMKRFRGKRDRARLYREFDVGSALVVRDDAHHHITPAKRCSDSALKDKAGHGSADITDVRQARAHPHIVGYYSAFQEEGFLHIQMELCPRGTLRSVLELCCSRGIGRGATNESTAKADLSVSLQLLPVALCEPLVWSCMCSIARGIAHVHSHGFVHLDLKPDNVFVSASGVLKIGDFGQADAIGANADGAEGDSVYMAAELLNSVNLSAADWSNGRIQAQFSTCAAAEPCSSDGGGDGDLQSPRTPMVSTHGVQPAADMFSIGAIALELATALLRVSAAADECWRQQTRSCPLPFTLPKGGARWVALRRGDVPCLHGACEAGWSYGRTSSLAKTVTSLLGTSASRPSAEALAQTACKHLAAHSDGGATATGSNANPEQDPVISIDRYMVAQAQPSARNCGATDSHAAISRSMRIRQLRKRPSLRVIINKRNISQQQNKLQQHHDSMYGDETGVLTSTEKKVDVDNVQQ